MRIRTAPILLSALVAAVSISTSFAHPLDVSSTSLTVTRSTVSAMTLLHPAEVERILGMRGISMRSVTYGDYYSKKSYVFDYLRGRVSVSSHGAACPASGFETRDRTVDEIFSEGFPVSYRFDCASDVRNLSVSIRIFDDIPLQTNRLTVFGPNGERLAYKVLTPAISEFSYDFARPPEAATDSDSDGLPDEEERAYRTDAKNPDTDGDGYADGEEVNGGWSPSSPDVWPGQAYREARPWKPSGDTGSSGQTAPDRYAAPAPLLDASPGNDAFKRVLKSIASFVETPDSQGFRTLFFLVVALGFAHAIGPGHSKALLASAVLDRGRGFLSGLVLALVFTVTHLADVVLLVLLSKYVLSAYDVSSHLSLLQRTGAGLLAVVASFLAYRAFFRPTASERAETVSKPSNRIGASDVALGLLAGLAPCAFGWSIFLVLFSLGKTEWALPLLFALGIGIFACLLLVLLATYFLRQRAFSFAPGLARASSKISASFLLVVAGFSVWNVW